MMIKWKTGLLLCLLGTGILALIFAMARRADQPPPDAPATTTSTQPVTRLFTNTSAEVLQVEIWRPFASDLQNPGIRQAEEVNRMLMESHRTLHLRRIHDVMQHHHPSPSDVPATNFR